MSPLLLAELNLSAALQVQAMLRDQHASVRDEAARAVLRARQELAEERAKVAGVCACNHTRGKHCLVNRETDQRGECSVWGCKCGLYRSALVQSPTRPSADAAGNDTEGRGR